MSFTGDILPRENVHTLRRTINHDSLLPGVLIRALLVSSRGSLLPFPVLRGCYLDEKNSQYTTYTPFLGAWVCLQV